MAKNLSQGSVQVKQKWSDIAALACSDALQVSFWPFSGGIAANQARAFPIETSLALWSRDVAQRAHIRIAIRRIRSRTIARSLPNITIVAIGVVFHSARLGLAEQP
jgi:hypothetical protein